MRGDADTPPRELREHPGKDMTAELVPVVVGSAPAAAAAAAGRVATPTRPTAATVALEKRSTYRVR